MNYLIIGRPNVGKSSIYNILTNRKTNIIHKDEGTTRDWHKEKIFFLKNSFVYDSPGIILKSAKKDLKFTINIIENLIQKIDTLLFVIDYKFIDNSYDQLILKWIRKFNKKIILLVNKKDNNNNNEFLNLFKLGIKYIFPLSCSHRLGFDKLKQYMVENNSSYIYNNKTPEYDFSIAVFGKPNSGKSTFLNTLIGYERSLVSNKAGTTSDYVFEDLFYKYHKIRIFDTAGIGRNSKVTNKSINYYAIKKTLEKIKDVNSSIILIDSLEQVNRQDKRIIKLVSSKSKSLLVVFNKIDLIKNKYKFKKNIENELILNVHQLKNIKMFFISSFSKKQIYIILNYILNQILLKRNNLNTRKINHWLKKCTQLNQHPLINKNKVSFKYAVKIKDNPITIKIFCNYSTKINKNYLKFLRNNFNVYFNILNQNTKFIFSTSKNPFN